MASSTLGSTQAILSLYSDCVQKAQSALHAMEISSHRGHTMLHKVLLSAALVAALAAVGQANAQDRAQNNPTSASSAVGDAMAGRAVFNTNGGCLACHRVGARGAVTGPNLSNAGARL